MSISIFELFSIGIGPSSSHTVGPMRAGLVFVQSLQTEDLLAKTARLTVTTYGSLAHTGEGHGTPPAILCGLSGLAPETINPDSVLPTFKTIIDSQQLRLAGSHPIGFDFLRDFICDKTTHIKEHSNTLRFEAFDSEDNSLAQELFYSIGGGFIKRQHQPTTQTTTHALPHPFEDAKTLITLCKNHNLSIGELMLANESTTLSRTNVKEKVLAIYRTMKSCIEKGCETGGTLPGPLQVKRRAPELYAKLRQRGMPTPDEQSDMMNWLNLYAMAVNEENAAGGRIVTAPTNGAAGIIPAVLMYYANYHKGADEEKIIEFLLTAGAIAILYKEGASISGAEVGCQGEVGVASSMAAAALTAVLGGTLEQIENAAEIAMEHHLGMTCDPIAGLVQIPCIERNAMGAVKAVNATRLALIEDGEHKVPLDKVIATMKATGRDMMTIYKETSQGGLAVNVIEC